MRRNVRGRYLREVSRWRKIAAVAWSPPDAPMIYGSIEVDIASGLDYIHEVSQQSGVKVTLNHLVVKGIAEALRRHPECNGMIRRNKIYQRDCVDVSVLVAVEPSDALHDQRADLSETMVRDADQKDLVCIAREIRAGARSIRRHEDKFVETTKRMFERLPPFVLKRALRLMARLEYQWNLSLERFGVPRDPFGSLLVTALGTLGGGRAFAPIPPFTNVPIIIAVGRVEERPVARHGNVVIRPILPLDATIDHRLIDGFQGARLARTLTRILENPARELTTP